MKVRVLIGVLALAVVVLILVIVSMMSKVEVEEKRAPAPVTTSLADQDAEFYRWVLRHPWSQNGLEQQDWTNLAGTMCGAFDRGAEYDDVATILVQDLENFTTGDAQKFVGKSVEVYCPEHLGTVA